MMDVGLAGVGKTEKGARQIGSAACPTMLDCATTKTMTRRRKMMRRKMMRRKKRSRMAVVK